jgi:hypothetical protein
MLTIICKGNMWEKALRFLLSSYIWVLPPPPSHETMTIASSFLSRSLSFLRLGGTEHARLSLLSCGDGANPQITKKKAWYSSLTLFHATLNLLSLTLPLPPVRRHSHNFYLPFLLAGRSFALYQLAGGANFKAAKNVSILLSLVLAYSKDK